MSPRDRELEKEDFETEHIGDKANRVDSGDGVRTPGSSAPDHGFTPEEQRKIIRRVDRRLVVIVGLMYCVSLMDRTNLSAAAIAGMNVELNLIVENRYSIASLVFFIPYILFQPPSTIIVRKLGPRIHLAGICLMWGSVMIGMGFSQNFTHLAVCRVLLGVLEAGFFPSCVYLLSTWYTRFEVGKRYSVFYLLGCVASAFAGILAYGLMQMNGLANLTGWRWIFIIEGIITCLLALLGYWLLVDFPDSRRKTWNFLGERELQSIWASPSARPSALSPPPTPLPAASCSPRPGSATSTESVAPSSSSTLSSASSASPIMGFHPNSNVRYFGVFLVTAGANSNIPAVMAYQANNIRGQWKRAFCSATLVSFGGVGGIAGSLLFRPQDMPHYRPGMYACIACCLLTLILVGILSLDFKRQNGKAERGEKELENNEEDSQRGFRYTY
ncbi:pantothenate transporter liz1 [Verticillium alfalfae VaMs.102]|uniref:Pantothenate transporter liz1 n=1 Tax=Verticillium alfalfae (strain VaMs.102 / ATCC MYA-4576 / FGSC 10136) TaxID=526221 RepID=C9SVW6_VERA1|nr:pantothenate transporter liz1 [Verticillium alfalfae VaMs.102]EEY22931.1 pantothenate transporter liz1 [Verticillium alfalfae VaMs.102]